MVQKRRDVSRSFQYQMDVGRTSALEKRLLRIPARIEGFSQSDSLSTH